MFKLFMMAVRIVATNLLYLLLMYFSADLIGKLVKMGQVSPALHLPMWFMYLPYLWVWANADAGRD